MAQIIIDMSQAPVVLEAENLSKTFFDFKAVNNVNLKIRDRKIHALIGPNGAGKTTVFNLLTKFIQPSSGKIRLRGLDITNSSPAKIARMGLVRSFQISAIFPHLTVLENIRIALQRPNNLAIQFWRSDHILKHLNDKVLELVETVGLEKEYKTLAGELPYGKKRALEIATTLALNPSILLLDEPMAGMGYEDIDRIAKLIKHLSKERSILMVEHNLQVVQDICDHITVLQRGEVLAEGSYKTIASDERVRLAYMGD